jgi:hypothetical protein
MAEASFRNSPVPLSQTLAPGTVGQPISRRDIARDTVGTTDLKTLARLVLARDTQRDRSPKEASHDNTVAERAMGHEGQGVLAPKRRGAETSAPKEGEVEEERTGIVQFDGNIPRTWAEGFARLHPDRPLRGVPTRRWLRFVDDVGLFLDSPFCATAAALGWGPYDLFGCDCDRPFARIDHLGLLWLLDGGRIMALTAHTATIKTSDGSIQTYRRRARNEPSKVLPWELT